MTHCFFVPLSYPAKFLLTHPVWDVTPTLQITVSSMAFLLTHPVWDVTRHVVNVFAEICKFLLTHPVWDVTAVCVTTPTQLDISTHTSRVGCDVNDVSCVVCVVNFYSHIPCGMWPEQDKKASYNAKDFYSHIPCGMWRRLENGIAVNIVFLLTHPVWDVTLCCLRC